MARCRCGVAVSALLALSSSSLCRTAIARRTLALNSRKPDEDTKCQPLAKLRESFDNSWVAHLSAESSQNRAQSQRVTGAEDDGVSNNVERPVYNGHYVAVKPTPLKNPRLVIHSPAVAKVLELSEEDVSSDAFLKFFSGDVDGAFDGVATFTWATPYALSIMGTRYTSNCPFKTGDGYGDGRAISVGEVSVREEHAQHPAAPRYELQLKGAGPTPFCRGADGRAVLRSSVREFLASEAMAALGVSTTRALSLIVSDGPDGDRADRPWYSDGTRRRAAQDADDPRLARYPPERRRRIVTDRAARSKSDPNVLIEEPCAITTRVSPSFVRVGHFDLYARRVVASKEWRGGVGGGSGGGDKKKKRYDTTTDEWKELEQMLWHACYREYPEQCFQPYWESGDVFSAARCLLGKSMDDLSTMVAQWIRVGFAQGNFNADNCLVAGRTMDYGPFGFMDEYHPLFAKWTGSGDHFGFMNQPKAGFANFKVLVESVMPLIESYDQEGMGHAKWLHDEIMKEGRELFERKVREVFRVKMGFHPSDESADGLWTALEPILQECRADWTVFWRQLYLVTKEFPILRREGNSATAHEEILELLSTNDEMKEGSSPFYEPLDDHCQAKFLQWIERWRSTLVASYTKDGPSASLDFNATFLWPEERMRLANPKYTLREWMLVEAYTKASTPIIKSSMFPVAIDAGEGDESIIHELLELVQKPYNEGSEEQDKKYFRRAPEESLTAGGTAYMS